MHREFNVYRGAGPRGGHGPRDDGRDRSGRDRVGHSRTVQGRSTQGAEQRTPDAAERRTPGPGHTPEEVQEREVRPGD